MSQINYINTDCFNYMKTLPDESVDLIVTDPPYGISFDASNHMDNVDWDKMGDIEYEEFLDKLLAECYRILKPTGTMWMFYGITKIESVIKCINKSMFFNHWENAMVYCRPKGRGATHKLKSQREEIVHLTKDPKNYTWNAVEYLREVVVPYVKDGKARGWALDQSTGMRVRWTGLGNVSFFTPPAYNNVGEKQIHSCQKPILLFTELIMLSSKKGEKVLDPFMGSGSSGVAAHLCERDYTGCELETDMFQKASEWLKEVKNSNSRVAQKLKEYIKHHVSSSEKGFRFGFNSRLILPKKC